MSDTPLEIKVVYDSRDRGRLQPRANVTTLRAGVPNKPLLIFVAIGSLIAACAGYYLTWWKIDLFLYTQLMMKTPVVPVDPQKAAAALFGFQQTQPVEDEGMGDPDLAASSGSHFSMKTTQIIIGATVYGWLTLATLATCLVAVSSGAAWGRLGGPPATRVAAVGLAIAALVLALAIWSEVRRYGRAYPPDHLRLGMGALVLIGLALGGTMRFRVRGAAKWAGLALIVSAVGSVAGLYLGGEVGAIEAKYRTPQFLGMIFAAQSLWGWALLILSPRLR